MTLRRRTLLTHSLAAGASLCAAPAWAQTPKTGGAGPSVVQVVDMSPGQIDVSKDFLVGARAAWQDLNSRGGVRNKPVRHVVLEVDGSSKTLRSAVDTLKGMPECVAAVGSVGDRLASQLAAMLRRELPELAHVAPWLHSPGDGSDNTFSIFATRQEQMAYALKSLTVMGVQEIGAVYGSPAEASNYRDDMERAANELKLRIRTYQPSTTLNALANTLNVQSPRILIFMGGTPELAQFAQGIEKQAAQRYIVAMSDVNVVALQQLGISRFTPVIATQSVPPTNSNLPLVRNFREVLTRLYDEPPSAQSLAGFVSARYCAEVLQGLDGPLNRGTAFQAFAKRQTLELGGLRLNPDTRKRTGVLVTQSMLGADGKIVG
ncbi:ABC transporter substrate-binding protein [Rhodoferax bucti]|uniref:ABC transporter substrate-binding protein n=1 Tax=Rhodoferax bucti TaxID=2576305 RepID=UPI001108F8AE|nr:ABC transporter substrate-binding protein [Rhodoferax bucti]